MISRFVIGLVAFCAFTFAGAPSQAAKIYVDAKLGDVPASELVAVAEPQPVQFIVEFQTDGLRNGKATDAVKPMIVKAINDQKVFASISDTPVASKAVLSLVINNITEKGAAGKGFTYGLTLGLAGIAVTDRYAAHFELLPGAGGTPIVRNVEHALHMTMGKKGDPSIGVPVKKVDDALQMVIRQIVAHGLNGLAADPAFAAAVTTPAG